MQPNSRREFFRHLAKFGVIGGAGVCAAQSGCVPLPFLPFPVGGDGQSDGNQPNDDTTATWPYPYSKLDVEAMRKRGHQQFYAGDCCYGAFSAIVLALADKVGAPFTSMPVDMMRYGKGKMDCTTCHVDPVIAPHDF